MSKYNWDERRIITFPEEKVVLSTKDFACLLWNERVH